MVVWWLPLCFICLILLQGIHWGHCQRHYDAMVWLKNESVWGQLSWKMPKWLIHLQELLWGGREEGKVKEKQRIKPSESKHQGKVWRFRSQSEMECKILQSGWNHRRCRKRTRKVLILWVECEPYMDEPSCFKCEMWTWTDMALGCRKLKRYGPANKRATYNWTVPWSIGRLVPLKETFFGFLYVWDRFLNRMSSKISSQV